jgi:hypothetical protein
MLDFDIPAREATVTGVSKALFAHKKVIDLHNNRSQDSCKPYSIVCDIAEHSSTRFTYLQCDTAAPLSPKPILRL